MKVAKYTAVVVVPTDLYEFGRLVLEDRRVTCVRREEGVCLPSGMCRHRNGRQQFVSIGVQLLQDGCHVEAVYEKRRAARTAGVLEQVEELQPAWIGLEVSR